MVESVIQIKSRIIINVGILLHVVAKIVNTWQVLLMT